MRARKWLHGGSAMAAAVVVLAAGCSSGSSSAGPQTRTVQVDYRHDEFAASLFDYFPRRVQVRPGDTVEFKQAWTGEPHSVTMGTLVDERIRPIIDLVERVKKSGDVPTEEPPEFQAFGEALPYAFGEGSEMAQNAAQPCYVEAAEFDGSYPGDEKTPCPTQAQPAFNGRQAIYNSGVIPFEGVGGNTFRVQLADDLRPGTYNYYCNVHGPLQYGQLEVKEKGAEIPSSSEVARQARRQAEEFAAPMLKRVRDARAGKVVEGGDEEPVRVDAGRSRLVGVPTPFFEDGQLLHGVVNEFVPRRVEARVGQKVTWTFISGHTLSFNVPKYFPVFTIERDGTVKLNPKAFEPVAWPGRPEPEGGGPEGEGHDEERGPPEPVHVDVGPWDGRGFKSTGLDYQDLDTFSVTFTRPGTYDFACLIHPQMVGELVVKG